MTIIIVNDFYEHPDEIRKLGLSGEFNLRGNFSGARSECYLPDESKEKIQSSINSFAGEIVEWIGHSGRFQLCTSYDKAAIHSDFLHEHKKPMWAGVIYLTPNAPAEAGTAFFRHKKTGRSAFDHEVSKEDEDFHRAAALEVNDWEITSFVGNVYNRAVFYRGEFFHRAMTFFGSDKTNSRLTQAFFFVANEK